NQIFVFIVLMLVFCIEGCKLKETSAVNKKTIGLEKDSQLTQAVKRAVEKRIDSSLVEEFVGLRATLHTGRTGDRDTLLLAKGLDADREKQEELPDFDSAIAVVYWIRPIESKTTKIIGIVWNKNNSMEVFWGVIYHP